MDRLLKSIIMAVIGDIDKPVPTMLAKTIHSALGFRSRYRDWVKSILKRVVLVEGVDYVNFEQAKKKRGGRSIKHLRLTIDAAKRVIAASGSPKAYALAKKIDDYMAEYFRPADTSTKNDEPKPDPEPIVVAKTSEGFVQVFKYDFFSIYNFQMVDGRAGLSKFEGVHRVRVVPFGFEPWFVAEDIAVVLWFNKEYRLFRMVEGLRHRTCTIKGKQTYLIDKKSIDIAVELSRNPDKHNFQPWIEGTVIPDFYAKMGYEPRPAPEPKPEPKVEVVDEPEEAHASPWITDPDNKDVIFDDYSEDDEEPIPDEPEAHTPPSEEKPDMNPPEVKTHFFDKTRSVRSLIVGDNPWIVANDLCKLMGLVNTSGPIKHLRNKYKKSGLDVNDLVKHYPIPNTRGKNPQDTNILSEKGAYYIVSHCRKKNALQIRKWIEDKIISSYRTNLTHTEPNAKDENNKTDRVFSTRPIPEEPVINSEPIKETETMEETPIIDQEEVIEPTPIPVEPEKHTPPNEEEPEMNMLPSCKTHFYDKTRAVRSIMVKDNPWFVAKDVCDLLSLVNNSDAISTLRSNYESIGIDVDRVVNSYPILDAMGRLRDTIILSESATYDLIFQSRKPEALKIKYWVTSEVMPSIRKTGGYGTTAPALDMNDPVSRMEHMVRQAEMIITMANNQKLLTEKVETITQEKETIKKEKDAYAQKAEELNGQIVRISASEGSYNIRSAATTLNVHQKDFFAYLESIKWIYKKYDDRDAHLPLEKRNYAWQAYSPIIGAGWMEHVKSKAGVDKKTGKQRWVPQALMTSAGIIEMTRRLPGSGVPPLNPNKPTGKLRKEETAEHDNV